MLMYDLAARDVFSKGDLARICTMREENFGSAFGLDRYEVPAQRWPDDFYFFQDNGADVLAVAHLDTVVYNNERNASFANTEAGLVVHSGALDDRLGAYIILDMLPKLGIKVDVLLTVGEEMGQSTAAYFTPPKQYDWMIEFDRGGTDVVTYQYEDRDLIDRARASGARHGQGIFSDISYLSHLGCKGANWGVGYQDYHGPRAHAYLEDTFMMVDYWQTFYAQNVGEYLPHIDDDGYRGRRGGSRYGGLSTTTIGEAYMALQDDRGNWDDLYPEARYTPRDESDDSALDWHPSWHSAEAAREDREEYEEVMRHVGYHGFNDDVDTPAVLTDMADPTSPFYVSVDKGA